MLVLNKHACLWSNYSKVHRADTHSTTSSVRSRQIFTPKDAMIFIRPFFSQVPVLGEFPLYLLFMRCMH